MTQTPFPASPSQNPIKSALPAQNGNKLILAYQNGDIQSLSTEIKPRPGYNGAALLGFDLDAEKNLLSLTFRENAALNRAEILLGNAAPAPKPFLCARQTECFIIPRILLLKIG